ncbi:MAG: hypothetical protein KR126chlam6_00649 [Candidatus Anoxychlamydiales bacterium]|nr:hypothetical protein [Candidatus Anoxychlamydiales bacterium]
MSSGCGAVAFKVNDGETKTVGCGGYVESNSCGSGCGSFVKVSVKILKWSDCDTIGKKIGFVFSNVIKNPTIWTFNKISSGFSHAYRGISKVIKTLYIDKITNTFYKAIKGICRKLYNLSKSIFQNIIKPVFINKFTKKAANLTKTYLIDPALRFVKKVFEFVKTIFSKIYEKTIKRLFNKKAVSSESSKESKIGEYTKKCFNAIKTALKTILKPVWRWTAVPFYNRVLTPIGHVIEDIFIGVIGGWNNEIEKDDKEIEKPKEKADLI